MLPGSQRMLIQCGFMVKIVNHSWKQSSNRQRTSVEQMLLNQCFIGDLMIEMPTSTQSINMDKVSVMVENNVVSTCLSPITFCIISTWIQYHIYIPALIPSDFPRSVFTCTLWPAAPDAAAAPDRHTLFGFIPFHWPPICKWASIRKSTSENRKQQKYLPATVQIKVTELIWW